MPPFLLKLVPYKTLIIGSALAFALIGGTLAGRNMFSTWRDNRDKAQIAALAVITQEHLLQKAKLEGQVAQLNLVVKVKEQDLTDANKRLALVMKKVLPAMPLPPVGVDPCAEVREVAQEREIVLVEQRDTAIEAKVAAEEVIVPLKAALVLQTAATGEIQAAFDSTADANHILVKTNERLENSNAFWKKTWKVGGLTVGVAATTYILLRVFKKK